MTDSRVEFSSEIDFSDGDFVKLGYQHNQRCVMPLVHVRGGQITPLGTCFSITSDGLCLTARHVVEEAFGDVAHGSEAYRELRPAEGSLCALYISEAPPGHPTDLHGGLLDVVRFHVSPGTDVAMLRLWLPRNRETDELLPMPVHRLRVGLPAEGEPFFAFGYHSMRWAEVAPGEGVAHSAEQSFAATRGTVQEVHFSGRDQAVLPFPCYRVSGQFDGGMSGGPLIGHDGLVIGVVCSSMGDPCDGGGHISYASLIGPVMGQTLDASASPDIRPTRHFLWDLVTGGAVRADSAGVTVYRHPAELWMDFGGANKLRALLD